MHQIVYMSRITAGLSPPALALLLVQKIKCALLGAF
jgi:hypothetical protein